MEPKFAPKNAPFTCYFCNDLIENDTQNGHMAMCAHVLEPCPNKCGSYIQRNMKNRHLKECPNNFRKSSMDLTDSGRNHNPYNGKSSTLDRFSFSNTNTRQELSRISGRLLAMEENLKRLIYSNRDQQDEIDASKNQFRANFQKIYYQNQAIFEWKKHAETLFESLKQQIKAAEQYEKENDLQAVNLSSIEKLKTDYKLLNENVTKEQVFSRESHNDLKAKLEEIKDFCVQENATISALWADQNAQIERLCESVAKLSKNFDDHRLKYSALVFDVRTVNQISEEANEKVEIAERTLAEVRKDLAQLRFDVRSLEQASFQPIVNASGRFLWKIAEFSVKMKQAKDDEAVFKSPTFYTTEYGYKVRLIVFMNGLNKWKGRHLLAALHVLKGEYDLLQKWPCYIEADVTVRDLLDTNNKRNITKRIVAKRLSGDEENEEPEDSSTQYIFLPHSSLIKENYVKDDTIFIEIKVVNRTGLETML